MQHIRLCFKCETLYHNSNSKLQKILPIQNVRLSFQSKTYRNIIIQIPNFRMYFQLKTSYFISNSKHQIIPSINTSEYTSNSTLQNIFQILNFIFCSKSITLDYNSNSKLQIRQMRISINNFIL